MTQRIVPDPFAGAYAPIAWGGGIVGASTAAATYIMWTAQTANAGSTVVALTTINSAPMAFYIDPADWTVSGLTTKLRMRAVCHVGGTAPAVTLTVGLYPANFTNTAIQTAGTVVTGSTVAFASPAINAHTKTDAAADINVPAAGFYFIGVALSGTTAASSNTNLGCVLMRRWV